MDIERKSPPKISRREFLIGAVSTAVLAGCKKLELKPVVPDKETSFPSMAIFMATFLEESHPGLEFDPVPTYSQIFSKLRDLPFDEQEKLLVGFYSQKVEAFPNGEELGKFLARINNISWLQPKNPPDEESLENLCRQILSRLNLPDLTLRIIKEARDATRWYAVRGTGRGAEWDAALGTARYAAWSAAGEAALGAAARDMAQDAIRGVKWDATWDAGRDATRGAEWIVVKDLMPQKGYSKGNPFEPLMGIYELGCWPIGIVPDQNGKKEFVVFIPPVQKTTS